MLTKDDKFVIKCVNAMYSLEADLLDKTKEERKAMIKAFRAKWFSTLVLTAETVIE